MNNTNITVGYCKNCKEGHSLLNGLCCDCRLEKKDIKSLPFEKRPLNDDYKRYVYYEVAFKCGHKFVHSKLFGLYDEEEKDYWKDRDCLYCANNLPFPEPNPWSRENTELYADVI